MRVVRDLPISVRLALMIGAALFVLLSIAGAVVYELLGAGLRDNVDRALTATTEGLLARMDADDDEDGFDIDDFDDREESVEQTEGAAQLLDASGSLLAVSSDAWGLPPLLDAEQVADVARGGAPLLTTIVDGGIQRRVLAAPTGGDVAVVAVDTAPIVAAQRALLSTFGPAVLLSTALAALTGYGIARRGLAPVARMTAEADTLGHTDLQRRLSLPLRNDEIRRLGTTLNGMLARLDAAVERERVFTADASHELRTPLAILRAELDLARRNPSEQHVLRSIDSALEEADRLAGLVDDLLVLARADADRLASTTPLDLGELAGEVVHRFAPIAESRDVDLRASGAAVVPGDARALQRALANLVDNAVRHTPSRGAVDVVVAPTDHGARVTVRDTGPGVDDHQLPRLFQRFTRIDGARNAPGGAGLGLAIVAVVAAAHDGRVTAVNHPDGGLAVILDIGSGVSARDRHAEVERQPSHPRR